MIHYNARITRPHRHQIGICMRFEVTEPTVDLHIPAWMPGSYLIREFSRFIGEVEARGVASGELAVEKVAKGTWRLAGCTPGESVEVGYTVYGHELNVRVPHVDASHGFFNGCNVFFYMDGRRDEPCAVTVDVPNGWHVFTPIDPDSNGTGWVTTNYDELADAQFECGEPTVKAFETHGVTHRLIFWGDDVVAPDYERIAADTKTIVDQNASLFGDRLPYPRYDFIFHITPTERGGIEHLNGTVLATPWRYFQNADDYLEMLGLISHEHFHVWNVKRIKPRGLVPFDYGNENYTRALWVAEGFTSYFDDLNCRHARLFTVEHYLETLGKHITRLQGIPGRLVQSLEEASFDAWIRLYRPDDNTPNRTVSYYLKGALAAWLLDITIRHRSAGTHSLADVIFSLWQNVGDTYEGFDERAIGDVIEEATHLDLRSELHDWVETPGTLPFPETLSLIGLRLIEQTEARAEIGWTLNGNNTQIKHVTPGGPAAEAGLYPGDQLVAIDRRRLGAKTAEAEFKRLRPGRAVSIHFFRRDVLRKATLVPAPPRADKWTLELDEDATMDIVALRDAWLGETTSTLETDSAD